MIRHSFIKIKNEYVNLDEVQYININETDNMGRTPLFKCFSQDDINFYILKEKVELLLRPPSASFNTGHKLFCHMDM